GQMCSSGIPVGIDEVMDEYAYNASAPPRSDSEHPVEVYAFSDNRINRDQSFKVCSEGYTEFRCSERNPLEFVVGFGKEFSVVYVGNHHEKKLHVEAGVANPIVRAGFSLSNAEPKDFIFDANRTIEGYADPNPLCDFCFGGDVNVRTGYGSGRIFKFRAWPFDGEDVVGIRCVTIK
ncbi:MAG: hypothetical protein ABIH92_05965, partial [Nanoarchaeota archaeon]